MKELQELLKEGFHTYQTYLSCTTIAGDTHISLLKWPDIAQSALALAAATSRRQPKEIEMTKQMLRQDLIIAVTRPIEVIHESARERVKAVTGVYPPVKVSQEGRQKFPISYKNDLIKHINNMFTTLTTLTEINYPKVEIYNGSNR